MPVLATGANVRYEHKVKIRVLSGLVSVSDNDENHQALSEGDTYTSPNRGGVSVRCVESAYITVEDAPEQKAPRPKVPPKRDVEAKDEPKPAKDVEKKEKQNKVSEDDEKRDEPKVVAKKKAKK